MKNRTLRGAVLGVGIGLGLIVVWLRFAAKKSGVSGGVSMATTPSKIGRASSISVEIQKMAAVQLHKSPAAINQSQTFAALGADNLDIVELTMAVEDKLGITIEDSQLDQAAGITDEQDLASRLTLRAFAQVAAASPKQTQPRPKRQAPQASIDAPILKETQAGSYKELSKKPNPKGYVLVFVPSLQVLFSHREQQLGRRLNDAEREALKAQAVVIALSPAKAAAMRHKQIELGNQ